MHTPAGAGNMHDPWGLRPIAMTIRACLLGLPGDNISGDNRRRTVDGGLRRTPVIVTEL